MTGTRMTYFPRFTTSVALCIVVVILLIVMLKATPTRGCPSPCFCHGAMVDCYSRNLDGIPDDIPDTAAYVNLERNQIKAIVPERLTRMLRVSNLLLKNNQIASVPSGAFVNITTLKHLDLSNNLISEVQSDAFQNLPNLLVLKMDHNQLTDIQGYLSNLPTLERLDLNSNLLTSISDDTFSALDSLTYLSLSTNQISAISKNAFVNMTKLSSLVLSMNPLTNTDAVWRGLSVLSSLDLSSCQLGKFPTGLPNQLKFLKLSNNSLTIITVNDMKQNQQLGTIYLDKNQIRMIEDGAFRYCPSLSQITLSGNRLRMLPRPIPANVTSFDADNNEIQRLFQFNFDHDSKMVFLSLKNNSIEALAANTFSRMTNLESLYLDSNNIEVMYQMTYSRLARLRMLSLDSNPVREIERSAFSSLTRLSRLRLSGIRGKVKGVDEALFRDAPSLTSLDIQSSPHLASSILSNTAVLRDLRLIKYLNLMNNNLTSLDGSLQAWLPKLKAIRLMENPWQCDNNLRSLKRWMSKYPRKFTRITKVLCQYPEDLKGKPIFRIDIKQFTAAPTTSTAVTTLSSTKNEQSTGTTTEGNVSEGKFSASTISVTSSSTTKNSQTPTSSTKITTDKKSTLSPTTTTTKGFTSDMRQATTIQTTAQKNSPGATSRKTSPSSPTYITTRVNVHTAKPHTVSILPFFTRTQTTSPAGKITVTSSQFSRTMTNPPGEPTTTDEATSKNGGQTASTAISTTSQTAVPKGQTSPTPEAASPSDPGRSLSTQLSTSSPTKGQTATTRSGPKTTTATRGGQTTMTKHRPSTTTTTPSTRSSTKSQPSTNTTQHRVTNPNGSNISQKTTVAAKRKMATAKSGESRLPAIQSSSTGDKSKAAAIGVSVGLIVLTVAIIITVYVVYTRRKKGGLVDSGHFSAYKNYEEDSDTANIIQGMHGSDLQSGTLYSTDTNGDASCSKTGRDSQPSANGRNKKTAGSNNSGRFGLACFSPNSQDDSEIMLVYSCDEHNP